MHFFATTLAQTAAETPPNSFWDLIPGRDLLALILGVGIIALLIYWARPGKNGRGFTIHVDEEDITFTGNFPPAMEATVIEFLRKDCQIPGAYQVSGHWEERMLIIAVRGEQARPVEQRIRNFLKLQLKPPSARPIG